jgi:peptide-methionine (S)-S-oxide reductase
VTGVGPALATVGGGCFWCTEAVFSEVPGIRRVTPGYAGGHVPHPTYEEVCQGDTGHAEVVQLEFDPDRITYRDILEIFFSTHDPTTPNRQGADVGSQYRSVIFYHDEDQRRMAAQVIQDLQGQHLYRRPIVTEVVPYEAFYPAEEYHHQYFRRNPQAPYCTLVIAPKMAKFRAQVLSRLARLLPTEAGP